MTQEKKDSIAKAFYGYFKANWTIWVATGSLFWNISYQGGGAVVKEVRGIYAFVVMAKNDHIKLDSTQKELSEFKANQRVVNDKDSLNFCKIERLITKK